MAQGRLTIDLNALASNYHTIKSHCNSYESKAEADGDRVEIGAVVKANAYSLGAVEVVGRLIAEGCTRFFVATPEEALALRAHYSDCTIMVLNGFYASRAEDYIHYNLIPIIGSFMEIKAYRALAGKHGQVLPVVLNFNIRMNRLGLGSVETDELLANMDMLDGLDVQMVMSHFACADIVDHPMTEMQYEIFSEIAAHFPQAKKSLANSSGIFRNSKYHFDIVRPGMALYGLNPTPEKDSPVRAVVNLDVPIMRVRLVYKDAAVGYGATYIFEQDTWIATVSSGYADGLHWSLSNHGVLYWSGYPCPIRGRVSMDMMTVDLSAVPDDQRPKPGDHLEVIGSHQNESDIATKAGSLDYEVLTSLGNRYERIYLGGT